MDDERLRARVKRADGAGPAPRRAFADALHDDLAARLGLSGEPAVASRGGRPVARGRHRGRPWILLAAALLLVGAAVAVSGAGSILDQFRQPTLLESIKADGTLRVAVRADHPQSQPTLDALDGFDLALAEAVAERLGVRLDIVIVAAGDLPLPGISGAVLAMPSRALPAPVAAELIPTRAYYRWPVYLVVAETDGEGRSPDDLAGSRVCAVAGSAGEAWLAGTTAEAGVESVQSPPADVTTITRGDDEGCLDALERGDVDAAATSRLLPTDVTVTGAQLVGDGPVAREPAVIVVGDGRGAGQLRDRLDAILDELRRDGTLGALSQRWFGGEDLTTP